MNSFCTQVPSIIRMFFLNFSASDELFLMKLKEIIDLITQ